MFEFVLERNIMINCYKILRLHSIGCEIHPPASSPLTTTRVQIALAPNLFLTLLALRVTLRLQEDKPSTHQNISGLKGCEWVSQRDFKERKDKGDHYRSVIGHLPMES